MASVLQLPERLDSHPLPQDETPWFESHEPARSQYRKPRRAPGFIGQLGLHTGEIDPWAAREPAQRLRDFIRGRADPGSYTAVADHRGSILLCSYTAEAWQASAGEGRFNRRALALGWACRTVDWKRFTDEDRVAYLRNGAIRTVDMMRWAERQGRPIPLRRLTKAQAFNDEPGIFYHGTVQDNRTDPGMSVFPWEEYAEWVVYYDLDPTEPTKPIEPEPGDDEMKRAYLKDSIAEAGVILDTYRRSGVLTLEEAATFATAMETDLANRIYGQEDGKPAFDEESVYDALVFLNWIASDPDNAAWFRAQTEGDG